MALGVTLICGEVELVLRRHILFRGGRIFIKIINPTPDFTIVESLVNNFSEKIVVLT